MEKDKIGLCEDWEYNSADMTEGEWAQAWSDYFDLKAFYNYRVDDIVDYFGKRCKIVEDSGVDPSTGEEFYLLEIVDKAQNSKMTWWVTSDDIRPWVSTWRQCECGAKHVKGSENFHAFWCPAHKDKK